MNNLAKARSLAERVRFSGDKPLSGATASGRNAKSLRSVLYQNSVRISDFVTPLLANSVRTACERLEVPEGSVEAFIVPSPAIQGECLQLEDDSCALRFTSAMVNLLSSDEFEFVVGHEIGHFLFSHTAANQPSIESFMQQRRQEISVDRIGLLASGSLDCSIRALMKTVSGLTGEHIRFDVGHFLSQLRNISDLHDTASNTATHPSILVRCRALLWFSLRDSLTLLDDEGNAQSGKMDGNIERDLDRFVDGPAKRAISSALDELALWTAGFQIIDAGAFTKRHQQAIVRLFDADTMEKLKVFLSDLPQNEASSILFERVETARRALESLIPSTFEREVRLVNERVSAALAGNG
jgi:Peptidase family M48